MHRYLYNSVRLFLILHLCTCAHCDRCAQSRGTWRINVAWRHSAPVTKSQTLTFELQALHWEHCTKLCIVDWTLKCQLVGDHPGSGVASTALVFVQHHASPSSGISQNSATSTSQFNSQLNIFCRISLRVLYSRNRDCKLYFNSITMVLFSIDWCGRSPIDVLLQMCKSVIQQRLRGDHLTVKYIGTFFAHMLCCVTVFKSTDW